MYGDVRVQTNLLQKKSTSSNIILDDWCNNSHFLFFRLQDDVCAPDISEVCQVAVFISDRHSLLEMNKWIWKIKRTGWFVVLLR